MENYSNFNELDKFAIDIDDHELSDFKSINPDFYLHIQILACQKCIVRDNLKDGILQYNIAVNMLESLTRAAGRLPKGYDEELAALRGSEEFTRDDSLIRMAKEANKKFELLMTTVFMRKPIIEPLRARSRRSLSGKELPDEVIDASFKREPVPEKLEDAQPDAVTDRNI